MTDLETTVALWFSALNEPNGARRTALLEQAWTAEGEWVDPPFEGRGHAAINEMVDAIHQQYPRHRFRRASALDAHHDSFRVEWELVSPEGAVVLAGLDVATLDVDGRLARVTGFFGEPAAA